MVYEGHYAFSIVPSMERDKWIIDSGASIHICTNPDLLTTIIELENPVRIHLPNGAYRIMSYAGTSRVNRNLVLTDVLFVPEFTQNLISTAHLIKDAEVRCSFYQTHRVFQKVRTEAVIAT